MSRMRSCSRCNAQTRARDMPWAMRLLPLLVLLTAACASTTAAPAHHQSTAPASRKRHHHRRAHHHHPAHHTSRVTRSRHRPRRPDGIPAADMPNRRLTPGAVLTTRRSVVCKSGYASATRDVPLSEKDAVYARYHVRHVPYAHEVDHLVSLELGGSNAISNLWPEPYAGRWGARTKDALENRLHELVCDGRLPLPFAQRIEAHNWVAAYRRYVG